MSRALLLLLLAAAPVAAQDRVARRWAARPDVSVRVTIAAGMVVVAGWDRDSVLVTGTVPPAAGRFAGGGDPHAIKVAVEPPDAGEPGIAVLEVHVPRGASVLLKGVTTNVDVSGISGDLDVAVGNGRVHVEGAPRTIVAEALDGNIEVVGPAADVRVRSAGGTITLRGLRGDVSASSVSGPVLVGGAAVRRGRLESVSGEVSFKGAVREGGSLEVLTHSGDVELRLLPTTSADFDLGVPADRLVSEFRGERRARPGRVLLTTGNGGAAVTVRTFKGRVRLVRQPEADPNLLVPGGIPAVKAR